MKINSSVLRRVCSLMVLLPTVISPLVWAPKAQAADPKGIRLKVSCYFRVTNAIDGTRDDEVEIYGTVKFNGRPIWNVTRENAFSAVRDLNRRIEVGEQTFDVMFNQNSRGILKIDGFLKDHDQSGGDDAMWNLNRQTISLNFKMLYDRGARNRLNGVYISQGDRNRESADLIFIVSKVSDIM